MCSLARYDYENCESEPCNKMMARLDAMGSDKAIVGKQLSHGNKTYDIAKIDNFEYTDPIDGSVAKKQVSFIYFVWFITTVLSFCIKFH